MFLLASLHLILLIASEMKKVNRHIAASNLIGAQ